MADGSTKISRDEVLDLCQAIRAMRPDVPSYVSQSLGLYRCVRLVLVFLRHNPTQDLVAQMAGVSQPAFSRVITVYTPLIAQALQDAVPTVEDLDPTGQLIIDGTLLPVLGLGGHPGTALGQAPRHIGDKGYTGLNMIVPKKRAPGQDLHPHEAAYNKSVNQIRYKIERVITTIKTWRTLSTGYTRPINTLPMTLTAILGIIFTYTPRISLKVFQ